MKELRRIRSCLKEEDPTYLSETSDGFIDKILLPNLHQVLTPLLLRLTTSPRPLYNQRLTLLLLTTSFLFPLVTISNIIVADDLSSTLCQELTLLRLTRFFFFFHVISPPEADTAIADDFSAVLFPTQHRDF